MHKMKHELL